MKLKELKEVISKIEDRLLDHEISIALCEDSLGPMAMTGIRDVQFGFDWEIGHFIIFPQQKLVSLEYKK